MNKVELRTVKDAVERFMPDAEVQLAIIPGSDFVAVKVILPFRAMQNKDLYFFVAKRSKEKRFSILLPVESIGILAINSTLAILQEVLKTYGLILTQEAVIIEQEIALPFHKRMSKMAQALTAIDGIRRLWLTQSRSNNAEGQDPQSTGDGPDDRPSR